MIQVNNECEHIPHPIFIGFVCREFCMTGKLRRQPEGTTEIVGRLRQEPEKARPCDRKDEKVTLPGLVTDDPANASKSQIVGDVAGMPASKPEEEEEEEDSSEEGSSESEEDSSESEAASVEEEKAEEMELVEDASKEEMEVVQEHEAAESLTDEDEEVGEHCGRSKLTDGEEDEEGGKQRGHSKATQDELSEKPRLAVGEGEMPEPTWEPETVALTETETIRRQIQPHTPVWVTNSPLRRTKLGKIARERGTLVKDKSRSWRQVPTWAAKDEEEEDEQLETLGHRSIASISWPRPEQETDDPDPQSLNQSFPSLPFSEADDEGTAQEDRPERPKRKTTKTFTTSGRQGGSTLR